MKMPKFLTSLFANETQSVFKAVSLTNAAVLYKAQNEIIFPIQAAIPQAKLLGGTALSRCYLQHRFSYDLDFFVPDKFTHKEINKILTDCGLSYTTKKSTDGVGDLASQWHGVVRNTKAPFYELEVSFIEDYYYDRTPLCKVSFLDSSIMVNTEPLEGIYYRKLVCVAGNEHIRGRQRARDVFDLYTLSQLNPLVDFMKKVGFNQERFIEALYDFKWHEVVSDYEKNVNVLPPFAKPDLEDLRTYFDTVFLAKNIEEDMDYETP